MGQNDSIDAARTTPTAAAPPVPAQHEPEVLTQIDDSVLTIVMNRPAAHNAMTAAMSALLAAALDRLDADDDLSVGVLTGAGASFCSGMDLKSFLRGERPEVAGRGFGGVTERPPAKPLIAAVEGYALAGGFELVLACDLVVASDAAQFGLPEVRRGLIAGSGGLLRLGTQIPPRIATEYALTGRNMPCTEAYRWGLVNRIVPAGTSRAVAESLAREISRNAPLAVQESKRILTQSADWPAAERWDRQRQSLQAIFGTADASEGASAFAEKRLPVWQGR